jgi:putative ABC transport system permease protein
MSLVVRGYSDPASLQPAIRRAVRAIDPNQPVFGVETMDERLSNSLAQRRQRAWLLSAFAFLSVVVAMVGVYGVMAYSVKRRTHEIGVRIALGAQQSDILRLVLKQGMLLTLVGIIAGLAGAAALSRVMGSLLFGVDSTDLVTFTSVAILLAIIAFAACYIPARRAMRVDPLVALRYE